MKLFFTCHQSSITISDSLVLHAITSGDAGAGYYIPTIRYFIIPPSVKESGDSTRIDWNDYTTVTTFLNVAP